MGDDLKSLIKAYGEIREGSDKKVAGLITTLIGFIKETKTALEKRVDSALDTLSKQIDARLAKVKDGRDGRDGIDGVSIKGDTGEKGEPGAKGDTGPAGKDGRDGSPDSAEDIRNKLELLDGEERLDAKYIKNLPESKTVYQGGGGGATTIWSLSDVSIAGIEAGQHLEWDGIKWIAVTPAGGGGTPVYGEVLHTQGAGTSFTLANTPISGTVRVYRGGAYQAAGAGEDYTISGDTITLSRTLIDGEKLLADYSHN